MIDTIADEKIKKWIEINREEIISEWIEFCKIPSVVSEPEEGAPFGSEAKRALVYTANIFEKHGFTARIESDSYMVSDYGRGEKTIGLFGHADIVQAGEGWIYTKPFEPVIIENTLIGRGVSDNKSGVMAMLALMRIFRELGISLNSCIRSVVGSAEEVGAPDFKEYLKKESLPDFSLVPDSRFPCCVGERGVFKFSLKSKEKLQKIKVVSGGTSDNTVSDKTVAWLEFDEKMYSELLKKSENREDIAVSVSDNMIIVEAKGISAHISNPQKGINSTFLISGFLKDADALPDSDRGIMESAEFLLSDVNGKNIGIDFRDENFGLLTMGNGTVTEDDGHIVLSFNIRYGADKSSAWLEQKLEDEAEKAGWIVMGKNNRPAFAIDKKSKIPALLTDIYNTMSGVEPEEPFFIGGKTYASAINGASDKNIAIAVGTCVGKTPAGFNPGFQMMKGHGGAHSSDEKIFLDGFFDAIRVLAQYIISLDKCI